MKSRRAKAPKKSPSFQSRSPKLKRTTSRADDLPTTRWDRDDAEHREPIQVEGGRARVRLDRSSRKKYAGGGPAAEKGSGVPAYPGIAKYPGVPRNPGLKTYPGIGHYADGGDVPDAVQNFKNIARQFSSEEVSAPPIPSLKSAGNLASIPTPYADQNKVWMAPSLSPAESYERYKQTVSQRLPRLPFASGGGVEGPTPTLKQAANGLKVNQATRQQRAGSNVTPRGNVRARSKPR